MNGEKESEATLKAQIAETGGSQSLEPSTGGAAPGAGSSAPLSPAPPAPSVGVPENLRGLVEEILEETAEREVPTQEEHQRRINILSHFIREGMGKAAGKIINYGGKPDNYLYFEAPRVFAIAKEARCDYGVRRVGKNDRGYDSWTEDGVKIFYAEGWAQCPMLDASIGTPPGAGVGGLVTSEDKFMKGTLKSAGKWGHESNLMRKVQTQVMRKACVKLLGLDGITETVLKAIMKDKMPPITVVKFGD